MVNMNNKTINHKLCAIPCVEDLVSDESGSYKLPGISQKLQFFKKSGNHNFHSAYNPYEQWLQPRLKP